jgi:hypothetical protein
MRAATLSGGASVHVNSASIEGVENMRRIGLKYEVAEGAPRGSSHSSRLFTRQLVLGQKATE